MRILAYILIALIAALQYPMWLGKGGWFRVRELNAQVAGQRQTNAELKARNDALDAEVRDLKQGVEAVEERAREPARCRSRAGTAGRTRADEECSRRAHSGRRRTRVA